MAAWDDVVRIALELPETAQPPADGGTRAWRVRDKTFAWERPLRRGDLAALGESAPQGPILGVRVADLDSKEALLVEEAELCFTTPHFSGYPAVLVRLDSATEDDLRELLVEAWLARAPKRLARAYLDGRGGSEVG